MTEAKRHLPVLQPNTPTAPTSETRIRRSRVYHPEHEHFWTDDAPVDEPYAHPAQMIRGDCVDGHRPCPLVSCRWNLYLDISERTGNIIINFPDRAPEDMPPTQSCALDLADRGGVKLREIGAAMNLTRERARQIENSAIEHASGAVRREDVDLPDHETPDPDMWADRDE